MSVTVGALRFEAVVAVKTRQGGLEPFEVVSATSLKGKLGIWYQNAFLLSLGCDQPARNGALTA